MKPIFRFTVKCLAVCGAALGILLLLNSRYQKVWENPYSDADKFHFMESSHNDIQICNTGSSHGEYAFCYDELSQESGYDCFNFAMASQTFDYDYAILSMYRSHFAEDCIMFIPVSYFSFNNEVVNEAEEQFLSAKYYTFLSPKYIPHYDPYVDIVTHRLPILSAGEDIVKLIPTLSLRVLAAGITESMEGTAYNSAKGTGTEGHAPRTAQTKKNAALATQFREKAQNRYQRHMTGKEEYFLPERIDNLYNIIAFCKDNGITPVLITTPYTTYYYELVSIEFREQFHSVVQAIADDCKISYYDYSEDGRFGKHLEFFSDADHLNTEGAMRFMGIIAKEIPEYKDFLSRVEPNRSNSRPDA